MLVMAVGTNKGLEDRSALKQKEPAVVLVSLSKAESQADFHIPKIEETSLLEKKAVQPVEPSSLVQNITKQIPILPILQESESRYFPSTELTDRPSVLHDVPSEQFIDLPPLPNQSVILRLFINEYGNIDKVKIEESFLPEAIEQMLIDTFSKAKFQPGKIGGLPVKSQIRIEVTLEDIKFAT
jgi:hypothetical protein